MCIPNPDIQSVKIYSLNVCGLTAKLKAPDLEEICANYDILCFTESKLDYIDVVNIPDFVYLPPLKRSGARRKSGGIIVFVKEQLFSHVEVLKSPGENVIWFMLKKCYL